MGNNVIVHMANDCTPNFFTVKFDEYSTSKDDPYNTDQLTSLILRNLGGHGLPLITLELSALEP